ncbi:hypothetical protein RSOL_362590 [Rhizoctonia solani AG-3 Rhs1AP]|uniref:Fungal-type protein kinase domain-containing protein n=2 Tax=Rhizoctonia solani AG-3 TaxID=1086053 RepID=A0A074RGG7_9AGAM|nr:hypothetical protein RSOL_362590 [Rhizoctonia solani AG-3 Rhs1AP]KEP45859.1 hypothetical protein V565_235760 [Rhizoctonia solani 123E]
MFQKEDDEEIQGKGGSLREPDVVLVSLASAKRARPNFQGDWDECVTQANSTESRRAFRWADILMSGEMIWHYHTLRFRQPTAYGTPLMRPVGTLPTHMNQAPFDISNISDDYESATSGVPNSSLFAPSGSTNHHVPSSIGTGSAEAVSNTPNERKRSAEHLDQDTSTEPTPKRSKKETNRSTNGNILDAVEKSGINGAEMLRCSLGRRHAFAMIVIDATLWIWWFDRQGAIQSTGINFIEDLPRFILLLACFQRFDIADWGFDEQLDPSVPLRHSDTTEPEPQTVEYEVDGKDGKLKVQFVSNLDLLVHEPFNLKGKSTNVFPVDGTQGQPPLVAKLYWPNEDHQHEVQIIQRARKNKKLVNHLPDVYGWRFIDHIGTRRIRDQLGISSNSPCRPRLLLMIISEELLPITALGGDYLVYAWLQCIRAHYLLWEDGIRHLDISLGNLMLRQVGSEDEPEFYGVINDWDLGDDKNKLVESRKDLTKTIMFTSLDLLEPRPLGAEVVQRYSHDLESFAWILIWVFLAVQDGKIIPVPGTETWRTSNSQVSREERSTFLLQPGSYHPHAEWQAQWPVARSLTRWLVARLPPQDPAPQQATLLEEPNFAKGVLRVRKEEVRTKRIIRVEKEKLSSQGKSSIPNTGLDKNQAFNQTQASNQKNCDQDDTPEERKELLRSLWEAVKIVYKFPPPPVPEIEGL